MENIALFFASLLFSLVSSAILVSQLSGALQRLLNQHCGDETSALFWKKILQISWFIAPLLPVLLFPLRNLDLVSNLRQALFLVLLGHGIVLLFLARLVWNNLVKPNLTVISSPLN